jgi:hypothetical protein
MNFSGCIFNLGAELQNTWYISSSKRVSVAYLTAFVQYQLDGNIWSAMEAFYGAP